MLHRAKWLMLVTAAMLALQSRGEGGIRLPDQPPSDQNQNEGRSITFNQNSQESGRSVRT